MHIPYAVGTKTHKKSPVFKVGNVDIKTDDIVKLLSVDMDFNLTFDCHIKNICKKKQKKKQVSNLMI